MLSISQVIDHLIEKNKTQVRIIGGKEVIGSGNTKDLQMLKNSLEKFTFEYYKKPFTDFTFSRINQEFLLTYTNYLEKRGADNGTDGALPNRLKKLQAVVNYARDMGIRNADSSIFRCVSEKMKIFKASPRIISYEVIQQIENIDRSVFSRIE